MKRLAFTLSLGLLMVGLTGSAFADKAETQARMAREKAAKKACAMGDFEKGADILTDLLVETNDPIYVYNQGRCYQQNNRWEQAISRFREYLRKTKDASESDRADTERQIADCEESLRKAAQIAPPPPVAPAPAGPVARFEPAPAAPAAATSETAIKPAPPPPDGGNGRALRTTGIVLAAVGVAAIGTGVGLALKSQSLSNKDYSQSREDERASLRTWGLVSYGVGAAAVATGVVLYIVGWPHEKSSAVALLPVVAPDGASMLLKGKF